MTLELTLGFKFLRLCIKEMGNEQLRKTDVVVVEDRLGVTMTEIIKSEKN